MNEWENLKEEHYMEDICIQYGGGILNFAYKSMEDFSPGEFKSYDEYLEVQMKSLNAIRRYFEICYYNSFNCDFVGQIERVTSTHVLFKRILVSGTYPDGLGFKGKEDHVWMEKTGFESYKANDCLSFTAEVYRYIKKNNGKMLDYGLRNPYDIEVVGRYEVPTDDELINQQIEQLVCETCLFSNQCFMGFCVANEEQRTDTISFLKSIEPGKFTEFTVMAAYEITGQVFSQLTGRKLDKNDPNYAIAEKILTEATRRNAGCIWRLEEALFQMLHPEQPRLYIE